MAESELTKYHEHADARVFRWNATHALVHLTDYSLTLVPHSDRDLDDPDATRREIVREVIEGPAVRVALSTFGELSTWANRRTSEYRHDADDWLPDPQLVLDGVYNRFAIREAMQWLYQTGVLCHAPLEVRSVRVTRLKPKSADPDKARALVMRCGDWTAFVVCCKPDSDHGSDPLFPEVANG